MNVTKKEIAKILRDYHWMINEIARQRKLLDSDDGQSITGQYGIDGSMPHGKGNSSDPVFREVVRRQKKSKWIEKLERQVLFIQQRIHVIQDEREKAVLECLLDGMSIMQISHHMGLSRRHVQRLRDSIVCRMSQMSQMSHLSHKLQDDKSAC